ncbi:putative ribonuclease BN [Caballeronia arvi]|uniref:Ribonuclease BN n=1 Tax=Caballeronia arvi TaxID=1777135 RepID=A0A158L380_9BURK|nr:putative ribonuclease BN [Caballeronia arvi]
MKYLPDGHVPWGDALVGGAISAVLFSVGKKLFALYLTHAGTANAFGAAGSLAVLLMWLYFATAVLLLGAEAAASRLEQREGATDRAPDASQPTQPTQRTPAPLHAILAANDGSASARPHVTASTPERAPAPVARHALEPGGTTWTRLLAKGISAAKVNPSRVAIAAAGAGLFVLTKGNHRAPRKR